MASNADHLSDDTSSSLGDSAYEVLNESTFSASESDDHGDREDWAAPNDQDTSDDVASLADTDHSKQTDDSESASDEFQQPDEVRHGYGDSEMNNDAVTSSAMTAKDHSHLSMPSIEFEEPQSARVTEEVDVIHTVHKFERDEAANICRGIDVGDGPVQLVATIRQTMTRKGLVLDRPFKIVYVGDTSGLGAIIGKVGAALAVPASSGSEFRPVRRPSRFNVVPVSSFGDSSAPDIELIDSSGLEIIVEHCTAGGSVRESGKHDTITLSFDDGVILHSRRDEHGPTLESSGRWDLPDVAIFYFANDDDPEARHTSHWARMFMTRHKVPSIVISQEPLWTCVRGVASLDPKSPQLCIESRGTQSSDNRVLRRLPIDLASFKNIDAGQMNRNLACLTGLHIGQDPPESIKGSNSIAHPSLSSPSRDLEKASLSASSLAERVNRLGAVTRTDVRTALMLGAVILCTIAYTLGPAGYVDILRSRSSVRTMSPLETSAMPHRICSTPPHDVRLFEVQTPTTGGGSSPVPSGRKRGLLSNTVSIRDVNTEVASLLQNPSVATVNRSDQFKVHVVGDCHIIVRPPFSMTTAKKRPKMRVEVTRNAQVVEHEVSKLFDGIYAVKLHREDAYGSLNVSVWMKSRHNVNQTFTVDFGNPWFKTGGWKQLAGELSTQVKSEYGTSLESANAAIGRILGNISDLKRHAKSAFIDLQRAASKAEDASLQGASTLAQMMTHRIEAVAQFVSSRTALRSRQIVKESVKISVRSMSLTRHVRKELAAQAKEIPSRGAHYLTTLCRAATGVDPAMLWDELAHVTMLEPRRSLMVAQRHAVRKWKSFTRSKVQDVAQPPTKKGKRVGLGAMRNR